MRATLFLPLGVVALISPLTAQAPQPGELLGGTATPNLRTGNGLEIQDTAGSAAGDNILSIPATGATVTDSQTISVPVNPSFPAIAAARASATLTRRNDAFTQTDLSFSLTHSIGQDFSQPGLIATTTLESQYILDLTAPSQAPGQSRQVLLRIEPFTDRASFDATPLLSSYSVDLGNDGTVEFTGTVATGQVVLQQITLPDTGLVARVQLSSSFTGNRLLARNNGITLGLGRINADRITAGKPGCINFVRFQRSISPQGDWDTIATVTCPTNQCTPYWAIYSPVPLLPQPITLPVPAGCDVHLDLTASIIVPFGVAAGTAGSLPLSIPAAILPVSVNLQFATFAGTSVYTSAGYEVQALVP